VQGVLSVESSFPSVEGHKTATWNEKKENKINIQKPRTFGACNSSLPKPYLSASLLVVYVIYASKGSIFNTLLALLGTLQFIWISTYTYTILGDLDLYKLMMYHDMKHNARLG